MTYALPTTIEEALTLRAAGQSVVLAGGTDLYPAKVGTPWRENVIDISSVTELSAIECEQQYWRIGALVTWSDLLNSELPCAFDGLKLAAREVGSIQIQNAATIVGNICNASPAADGIPPLLTIEAQLEIRSANSQRIIPVSEFVCGNRETALEPTEIVTAIVVPRVNETARSSFIKLGARKYLVISIAMIAANIGLDSNGRIELARIAVGSCAAKATRLHTLEHALVGMTDEDITLERLSNPSFFECLSPIDDIRASKIYRWHAARVLTARAIKSCLGNEPQRPASPATSGSV